MERRAGPVIVMRQLMADKLLADGGAVLLDRYDGDVFGRDTATCVSACNIDPLIGGIGVQN